MNVFTATRLTAVGVVVGALAAVVPTTGVARSASPRLAPAMTSGALTTSDERGSWGAVPVLAANGDRSGDVLAVFKDGNDQTSRWIRSGGAWTQISSPSDEWIHEVSSAPPDRSVVYLAGSWGLERSRDGGRTFTPLSSGLPGW